MDANGRESGTTTGVSPQKTPTFAEASVGKRSSQGLIGTLRLARFGAWSRLPGTDLPSVSLIPSGRSLRSASVRIIRVHSCPFVVTEDIELKVYKKVKNKC
jgi:hypothetical protein